MMRKDISMMKYNNYQELKEKILYKRIKEWKENELILDDNTKLSIIESEQDCCATAYGSFKDVKLDAVITNISEPVIKNVPDDDTIINTAVVTIYHNLNPIAIADCYADAGNGGYYYSVCAFKVAIDDKESLYEIVKAS